MIALNTPLGLTSPTVGRFLPALSPGARVRGGTLLGHLVRLGRERPVYAPEGSWGQVSEPPLRRWVEHGELLVALGELADEGPVRQEGQGEAAEGRVAVRSPMAATVYHRPAPGEPDFVELGASVARLGTVALIEVMKTFTPVKAPQAGVLERWAVEDGGAVEADAVICWLR